MKTRAITLDDLNAAIQGNRMNSMDGYELKELMRDMKDSPSFAGQVTYAAAKHVYESKRRVGLIQNPRKRPARKVSARSIAAAHRAVMGLGVKRNPRKPDRRRTAKALRHVEEIARSSNMYLVQEKRGQKWFTVGASVDPKMAERYARTWIKDHKKTVRIYK